MTVRAAPTQPRSAPATAKTPNRSARGPRDPNTLASGYPMTPPTGANAKRYTPGITAIPGDGKKTTAKRSTALRWAAPAPIAA